MHVLTYEMKRAHWQLTTWMYRQFRLGVKECRQVAMRDMTPARYDIMHVILQRPRWMTPPDDDFVWEMSFQVLVQKLGLHPSTISKCLRGLVRAGFLTRHLVAHDRRRSYFRVTWLGQNIFGHATDMVTTEIDDPFLLLNTTFAETAAWDEQRLTRRVGEDNVDNMLIGFGQRVRRCAIEVGSGAWPVYDPDFDDEQLNWKFAGCG